jgi:hypothetical protein
MILFAMSTVFSLRLARRLPRTVVALARNPKAFGDTSMLVRLPTGEPREDFLDCVASLIALVELEGSEIFASNR